MSTRNDYWAYLQPHSNDLMHYGVKGMKWGVRHDYVPTGRYRFINRRPARDRYSRSTARRSSASRYSTPQQRKIMNRLKIARGSMIVAGTAMAAYGGYRWSQVLRSPIGKKMIADGKRQLMNRASRGLTYAQNLNRARRQLTRAGMQVVRSNPAVKATKRVVGMPGRILRSNPAARSVGKVLSKPKRVVSKTKAGRVALKAYGTAAAVSDINSTYQWSKDMKKKGKVTKKDVGNLAKDLINPIPDNLPGVSKKSQTTKKVKKSNKSK